MTIHRMKGGLRHRNAKLNGRKAECEERYVWAIICVCSITVLTGYGRYVPSHICPRRYVLNLLLRFYVIFAL